MTIPHDAELVQGLTIPLVIEAEHIKGGFFVPIFEPGDESQAKAKAVESVTPPPPLRYL